MSQQEQQLEEEGEEGFGPILVSKLQVNAFFFLSFYAYLHPITPNNC